MLKILSFCLLLFHTLGAFSQATQPLAVPKIYALIIGVIPERSSAEEQLRYPQNDALAFQDFLLSPASGSVPRGNIISLVGSNATRKKILTAIAKLATLAGSDDLIVFYFSGHGLAGSQDNEGALVPFDYDPDYPQSSLVPMSFISQQLSASKAKMKQVYIDACHSGRFREHENFKAGQDRENIKIAAAFRASFSQSKKGSMAILSSRANEESREDSTLEQGIFTHFLLKGLKGEADIEKDGIVNAIELEAYVVKKVSEFSKNMQHPEFLGNYRPDFPMSVTSLNRVLKLLIKKNPGVLAAIKNESSNLVPRRKPLPPGACEDGRFIYGMCSFTNKTNRDLTIYKILTQGYQNALGTCDCFSQVWDLKIPPGKTVKAPAKIRICYKGNGKTSSSYFMYFSSTDTKITVYARLQLPIEACKDVNFELYDDDFDFIRQKLL